MNRDNIIELLKILKRKKYRQSGNSIMTNCPFAEWTHDDGYDRKPSFGISIDRTSVYNCFCCGMKGRLVMLPLVLSYYSGHYDTALAEFIQNNDFCNDYFIGEISHRENHAIIRELFYSLPLAEPCLSLTEEDINSWEIKYDKNNDALVFPVYNADNNLVALKGRSLKKKAFFYYDGSSNFKKEGIWYGINRINATRKKIVLCEGERDAILLSRKGVTAWACLGSITNEQLNTLKKSPYSFILFFDNDKAGIEITNKIISACKVFTNLYKVTDYSGFKDPADVVLRGKLMQSLLSIKSV